MTERCLHRFRIRCVNLKRKIKNALKPFHHVIHHLRLVDLRKSNVHIKHIRAVVLLDRALLKYVVDIAFPERLFETLLPGRIDPLADKNRARCDCSRAFQRLRIFRRCAKIYCMCVR